MNNVAPPGPSGPPPTANPYVELVAAAIKSGETAKNDATALMTANAVQRLVNRLEASTDDVNELGERLKRDPLNKRLTRRLDTLLDKHADLLMEAYACKNVLEGGEIYVAQKGNTKLAEFFHQLGAKFNSPEAAWPWENRNSAPAAAGAN